MGRNSSAILGSSWVLLALLTLRIPKGVLATNGTILMQCTFDNSSRQCGLQQSKNDNFDWTLHHGQTSTKNTGPNWDHTQQGGAAGRYIYIEASSRGWEHRQVGDRAVLVSPSFDVPPPCSLNLTFYYSMYGRDTGDLSVKIHGSQRKNIWLKSGEQHSNGDVWSKATIEFPPDETPTPFKFEIIGTRGKDYLGDIAVDDVVVMTNCSVQRPVYTNVTTTIDPTTNSIRAIIADTATDIPTTLKTIPLAVTTPTTKTTTTTTPTTTTTTPTTTTTAPTTTTTTPTTTTTTPTTTTTTPTTTTTTPTTAITTPTTITTTPTTTTTTPKTTTTTPTTAITTPTTITTTPTTITTTPTTAITTPTTTTTTPTTAITTPTATTTTPTTTTTTPTTTPKTTLTTTPATTTLSPTTTTTTIMTPTTTTTIPITTAITPATTNTTPLNGITTIITSVNINQNTTIASNYSNSPTRHHSIKSETSTPSSKYTPNYTLTTHTSPSNTSTANDATSSDKQRVQTIVEATIGGLMALLAIVAAICLIYRLNIKSKVVVAPEKFVENPESGNNTLTQHPSNQTAPQMQLINVSTQSNAG